MAFFSFMAFIAFAAAAAFRAFIAFGAAAAFAAFMGRDVVACLTSQPSESTKMHCLTALVLMQLLVCVGESVFLL